MTKDQGKMKTFPCSHLLRYLVFFTIVFSYSYGEAQSPNIDSLKNILPTLKGIPQADLLNTISKRYRDLNNDSSGYYAHSANTLSQQLGYTKGIAESYRLMGWIERNPEKSTSYFNLALLHFEKINNKRGIADTYNNLGTFWNTKNDTLSLAYYDSSLILYREIGYKKGESAVLNYIGIVYQMRGNYQKAIDYTLQGLDIRKTTNDYPGVVWSYINAGNIYLAGGQYESALRLFLQSNTYAKEHGLEPYETALNQLGKTYLLMKQYKNAEAYLLRPPKGNSEPFRDPLLLGQLYLETNRTDSALKQFEIGLVNARKDNDGAAMVHCLIGLSNVFSKENKEALAMDFARRAFAKSDSLRDKHQMADAALILATDYEKKGDYRKSLQLYRMAHSILDSISNETNENYQHKLAIFESKNQIEAEQAHVRLLSAEKTLQDQNLKTERLYKELILIGCGLILLISIITIRNINKKRNLIQSQRDLIDQQKTSVEKAFQELQVTQSQLVQREKMASLGELTAGIAHEIQNPLNFVNNFSDINSTLIEDLREELKKDHRDFQNEADLLTDIQQNEQKINHHGKRAEAIVKAMLLHSRVSTGQKERTDINALADEYLRLSYHGIRAKDKLFNACLQTDFDESIENISIIPQDFGRVLLNLFNNSFYSVSEKMKLMGENYSPTVSVITKKLDDQVELRVRDNGMGIPQYIIDKIYQPFFTTKPAGEGTGLGLSLSYDIVTKMHGGEIKVKSEVGEFAEFSILLPI